MLIARARSYRIFALISRANRSSILEIAAMSTGKDSEVDVGIEMYSTDTTGFRAVIKQRYADFIVREIDSSGRVARLQSTDGISVEKTAFAVTLVDSADSPEGVDRYLADLTALGIEFDKEGCREFLLSCVNQYNETDFHREFISFEGLSKEQRTAVHKGVKSYLPDTVTSEALQRDGKTLISLRIKKKGQKAKRTRFEWPQNLGEYLKFVILKENIDTMNALNTIGKFMHIKPNNISIAGTKDKRAVTAQWCTVFRRRPSELMPMNKFKYNPIIRIGDFEYVKEPLKMGASLGNRFEITLRDISVTADAALNACSLVGERGFVNYYGLQRFGKSNSHMVGLNMMKKNWKQVIDMILTPKGPDFTEKWQKAYFEGRFEDALQSVPDHFFIEKSILEGLAMNKTDIFGAFNRSPKQSRLICFHAYQSYIWNKAVSMRIKRYGFKCVAGDLIYTGDSCVLDSLTSEENDADVPQSMVDGHVRILTEQDLAHANFRDVVLPLPGYNILLPKNDLSEYYIQLLRADGIALSDYKSVFLPEYRASGAYRKIVQWPKDFEYSCVRYDDYNAELARTELCDYVTDRSIPVSSTCGDTVHEESSFLALKLAFSLPPGTYATMLLRELTKDSTDVMHQSSLTDSSRSRALIENNPSANADNDGNAACINDRLPDIDEEEQTTIGNKRAKV